MSENMATHVDNDELDVDSRRTVFGKPHLPEIEDDPFPNPRLQYWKPIGQNSDQQPSHYSILIAQDILEMINAHVSRDLESESGGFLLGNRYVCPNSNRIYVQIDNYSEAKYAHGDAVSLQFFNETFNHICLEKKGKFRGKDIIGWYHSHPNLGVFLSEDDVQVHQNRFPQPWTVALVIDPVRKTGGFFCWRDGVLERHTIYDFYELFPYKAPLTITYMPWTNYECFNSETGDEIRPTLVESTSHDKANARGAGRWQNLQPWFKWPVIAISLITASLLGAAIGSGWLRTTRSADSQVVRIDDVPPPTGRPTAQPTAENSPTPSPDNVNNKSVTVTPPAAEKNTKPTREKNARPKETREDRSRPKRNEPTENTGTIGRANKIYRKPKIRTGSTNANGGGEGRRYHGLR